MRLSWDFVLGIHGRIRPQFQCDCPGEFVLENSTWYFLGFTGLSDWIYHAPTITKLTVQGTAPYERPHSTNQFIWKPTCNQRKSDSTSSAQYCCRHCLYWRLAPKAWSHRRERKSVVAGKRVA